MNFHVGQKVVCINAAPSMTGHVPPFVEGGVYTITSIGDFRGAVYVSLAGVHGGSTGMPGWRADRFRPVVTRKTDISIFKRILANPHIRIEEDA